MFNFTNCSNNSRSRGFKSLITATALAVAMTGGIYATSASAQEAPSQDSQAQAPPSGGGHWGGHKRPSVDQQVKHLTKALKLNDDQQTKVRSALEDQQKQMEQIHNDSSLSRDDRASKMKEIHESTNTQIKSVLNDDQQKKFDQIQQKHQEHMREHQGSQPQQ
jgi:Spy/CpxP family protein refolding chaperone